MDIITFEKEWERMCKTYSLCSGCPIRNIMKKQEREYTCRQIFCKCPEEVVLIIEKWSTEHPAKTRQSEFLKMYPNVLFYNGQIDICPKKIDTTLEGSINCNITACNECKRQFWMEEVEQWMR